MYMTPSSCRVSVNPAHTCFNGSLSAYFGKGFAVDGANESRVVGEAVRIRYAIQYTLDASHTLKKLY